MRPYSHTKGIWGGNPKGRAGKEGYGVWRTRENSKIFFERKEVWLLLFKVLLLFSPLSRVCLLAIPGTAAH